MDEGDCLDGDVDGDGVAFPTSKESTFSDVGPSWTKVIVMAIMMSMVMLFQYRERCVMSLYDDFKA